MLRILIFAQVGHDAAGSLFCQNLLRHLPHHAHDLQQQAIVIFGECHQ